MGEKMDIEKLWYEYTPYLYAIAGVMSILHIGSVIGISFGLALVAVAVLILRARYHHRKSQADKNEHQLRSALTSD